jgi:hypothetical protein
MPFLVGYITPFDYGAVGDGVNDDAAAFQAAASAVAAKPKGGVLFIPPYYQYKINSNIELGPNTVVWAYGAYMFSGVGAGQGFLNNYLNQTSPTVYNGNSNITVLGGIWDAKGQVYTSDSADSFFFGHASNIVCKDVIWRNVRNYHAMEYNAINGGWVINCRFEGYNPATGTDPGEAFQVDLAIAGAGMPANDGTLSQNITMDGCYAGPASDGSGLGSFGSLIGAHSTANTNTYQGVRVFNSVADSCLRTGIHVYNWSKCEIVGNTILNSADSGILVETQNTGNYQPQSINITGNSVTGSANYGVYVNGQGAFAGNYVSDIAITGNTIRDVTGGTGTSGIGVAYTQRATVSGNTIYNTVTNGIMATNDTQLTLTGNSISTVATGISIAGSTQVEVTGNNVLNCTSNGIFLGQTAGAVNTSDVNVSGNTVENCTNAAIRGGTSATDVLVTGNKITQGANGTFGIELVSTNTGWGVWDNWLDGTWTLANALAVFNTTTKVTVTPDGRYGVRGSNWWGTQLNPTLTAATVANTASETVVGTFTIPANDAVAGGVYRMVMYGTASSTGTPTITFRVRLGGVAGTALATFGAVTTSSGASNQAWQMSTNLFCVAPGSSGTWSAYSSLAQQIASATGVATSNTMTNGTVTANSTTSLTLVVTAQWSAASASNTASSTAGLLSRDY